MRGRYVAMAGVAAAVIAAVVSVPARAAVPVLPIPAHLGGGWIAPAGTFVAPDTPVVVDSSATVDLSAATISGSSGYLFVVRAGGNLTIGGGTITGTMRGLVRDDVTAPGTATVHISNTHLVNVRSLVFAASAGGPVNVSLNGVTATGLGDGIRAVADAIDVRDSVLEGGGVPPASYPAGIHSLDDAQDDVAVPQSHIDVAYSTITGFRSPNFQGDSIVGETRVATADIEHCVLGHNSDTGGLDSKIGQVMFRDNTVYSDGYRGIAGHYGSVVSTGNTIYQQATSGKAGDIGFAYLASASLAASGDVVVLSPGTYLAKSDVVLGPASGARFTYPRIGDVVLTGLVDARGHALSGPTLAISTGRYRATVTVNP